MSILIPLSPICLVVTSVLLTPRGRERVYLVSNGGSLSDTREVDGPSWDVVDFGREMREVDEAFDHRVCSC